MHLKKKQVDSNDKLYGSDHKFISEVNKICSKVLEELLNHLKHLGTTDQLDKQSALAHQLFFHMLVRADLEKPSLSHIAVNLWNLSQKHGVNDPKLKVRNSLYTYTSL